MSIAEHREPPAPRRQTGARDLFLTTWGIAALLEIASDVAGFEVPLWIAVLLAVVWVAAGVLWAWTAFKSRGAVPREERQDAIKGWTLVIGLIALLPLGALIGLWDW